MARTTARSARSAGELNRLGPIRDDDGRVVLADETHVPGGADEPQGALPRVDGQLSRTLLGPGRSHAAASGFGSSGRRVELPHDALVGIDGRRRKMPCPAIDLCAVGRQGVSQGAMRDAALTRRGRPVDRRSHERVVEHDAVAVHGDEALAFRRIQRVRIQAEVGAAAGDHPEILRIVRGGDQQEPARVLGQARHPCVERGLELPCHRQRLGQRRRSRELVGAERVGQLDERQRVAPGMFRESRAHLGADAGDVRYQRLGGLRIQPRQHQIRQVAGLEGPDVPFACPEEDHEPLRAQAPGDEPQRVGGPPVQPVRVVDDAEDGPALGQLGEQRQAGGVDEEALLPRPGVQSERVPQCTSLVLGQRVQMAERRPQQLMQGGERELRLGFETPGAQHLHIGRALDGVLQESRLARARLTPDHQHAAA